MQLHAANTRWNPVVVFQLDFRPFLCTLKHFQATTKSIQLNICRKLVVSLSSLWLSHAGGACVSWKLLKGLTAVHINCTRFNPETGSDRQNWNLNDLCFNNILIADKSNRLGKSSCLKRLMCSLVSEGSALPGPVCPACLLWKKISLTCTGHPAEVYYVCVACVQWWNTASRLPWPH